MSRDSTVIQLRQPEAIDDPLTEVAREGARRMLATVIVAEAAAFVALWKDVKLPDGRDASSSINKVAFHTPCLWMTMRRPIRSV